MREVPAHIILKTDARPQVVKQYGIHYIIAPNEHQAAQMWLALLDEDNE